MRKLAIIPARGGSKRVPRKNIRNFLGQPIINYPLKAAFKSKLFDEVMVSTDDPEIADIGKLLGANIPGLRSAKNSNDFATTVDVIIEVIEQYQKRGIYFSKACCIYPTAALISSYDLRKAYNKMKDGNFETVFPITKYSYPIDRAFSIDEAGNIEMAQKENKNKRTQDLPEYYHDAGQFYWFDVKNLLASRSLFTSNTGSIILPEMSAQDIDSESDWKMAELKFKMQNHYYETENIL